MYKHILIDLDDTLWDFKANSRIAMTEIFSEYELNKYYDSFESFYDVYTTKNHQLWDQYAKGEITKEFLSLERFLYPLRIVDCENFELAKTLGNDFLHRTTLQTQLVEGAIELLEYLKDKYTLSIISNGFVEVQYIKLRRSGLLPYFDFIFLSEEIGYQKPDPRFFQVVLEKLNAKNTECLVIGDNFQTDIQGAQNAQIKAILYQKEKRESIKNNLTLQVINKLLEIKAIL
jgi:putative hydrolase of the HAD superfamily